MAKQVSDDDRQRAQAMFALSKSLRDISAALDGRVSPSWISRIAREENWQRGVLPEKFVTPEQPQIYESADASAEERDENNKRLQAAAHRRWLDHKAQLADEFGERIHELLERAFAPCVLKEVKVVAGPQGAGSAVEIVEVPMHLPPPADQVKLLTGVAILVDKASLLSGDATSRVETSSLAPDDLRKQLAHVRDEVAERRRQVEAEAAKRAEAAG